ncbi:hypothetical protein AB4K20DRAFT_1942282 [Rhizopus microsporus]
MFPGNEDLNTFVTEAKSPTLQAFASNRAIYKKSRYQSARNTDQEANYVKNLDYYCNIENKNERK